MSEEDKNMKDTAKTKTKARCNNRPCEYHLYSRRYSSSSSDGDDDVNIGANITICKGVMEKLKLLQRQVRIAEWARDYCDAFADMQPERGTIEYMAGYDVIGGLKQMSDLFRE